MSTTAILLVLSAAVAHAAWNVLAHAVSRIGLPFLWWGAVASTVLWAGIVPLTGGFGADVSSFALGVAVSAALHVAYLLVLQQGYRVGDLSTVYATARGSGPIISVVAAIAVLGERPAPTALAGVAIVIAGVLIIGAPDRSRTGSEGTTHQRHGAEPGVIFGFLTGAAIAAYTVWDAHAVRYWHLSPVAFMVGCTLLEVPLFSAALRRRHRELLPVLRAHWSRLFLFGVLSPLSYILVLVAVTLAPVALVAPMREVSVVLVSIYGALVLHERRARWRVAASMVVAAGILLIAL